VDQTKNGLFRVVAAPLNLSNSTARLTAYKATKAVLLARI